ncbi:MAG: restriction endonuclease subunit R [Rhodospirillales bacterium 70-18]|nr:MAG: restriction endonuclease subunit R [Rhodospirillales bacterium 70-18]
MAQFGFLAPEWPDIHEAAARAEALVLSDPRGAAFYARRALERTMAWLYKADRRLKLPYQDNLAALIHEPSFRTVAGEAIFYKARFLKDAGNKGVHGDKPFTESEARMAVQELFHVAFWLARSYARGAKPADGLAFDPAKLPRPMAQIARLTMDQLRKREEELRAKDEKLAEILGDRAHLDAELQRLREEVAAARAANAARPDTHDYGEAATRDHFIDLLLREAGWNPDGPNVAEYEVIGMPYGTGQGFVDYVLWGDDGKPLALVEAKATRHSALKGQQQAKLYADCLEKMHGQRPVIFCSNGYEHWIWDDTRYPPRHVQGFYKKAELALLVQRRSTRRRLADAEPNGKIIERHYQFRAIRRISETFEDHAQRKALVVMATGAGKTRTVIALADLLMRCNWAKRILFLADRVALVNQAVGAFKAHLPEAAPVNLVTDKAAEGRVFVSTYPTMMALIEQQDGAQRRFGVGHFDLVIVDEAHRSIYRKYGAIFDWFDSLLVGLTATPKDEIDHNTYGLFDLETGVPTDAYPLDEAVRDGYLVPMKAVSVPLKFQRQGIRYDDLSEEEKEDWDAVEWAGEDSAPERVEAEAVNKWLFNADTVDKVLEHLMTKGQHVEGGDRLGKTIVFAKNHAHAEFIQERFDANYPHLKGSFARVIDYQVDYAQSLIDSFSNAAKAPHIAISVDMLDTGIDVPEVVNLVFFKLVRSKTKFWQMIGRGTRLCKDLLGPGQDKAFFYVFDFCQNLEFFSQNPPTVEGTASDSLSARLFKMRLDLVGKLDARRKGGLARDGEGELRGEVAEVLHGEVEAMNVNNFLVRPKRRLVEVYAKPEAWAELDEGARLELASNVAGLPSEREPEKLEAKQFDLLMLALQLCVLGDGAGFAAMKLRVTEIAAALEEQSTIPAIRDQMLLIEEVQTDGWWQDITAGMLENARKRLRGLVHLIEKRKRMLVYTNFQDEIGDATEVDFDAFTPPDAFEKFRAKARHFLRQHEDHVAIHKLRTNRQLTSTDLEALEQILRDSGIATDADIERAKADASGLGLFVRALIGMDRAAAKEAFAGFMASRSLTANQIELVDMIVDHLTERGVLDAGRLYESPYTFLSPLGVEGVFRSTDVDEVCAILEEVRGRAAA